MRKIVMAAKAEKASPETAEGECLCGAVKVEIGVPARWAWHDHGQASRRAHGAAYATYVGSYRSRFRVTRGGEAITRFKEPGSGAVRSFCARCGTPLTYERARAPTMVNVSRALFTTRTGREPRYHLNLGEAADWAWTGEALAPLKGFPGVMWERPRRRKRAPGLA
ncbi:MAG TPA: GFA family protein [Caulobacteraceae bacterium]|jgi:hypothetical protein